MSVRLERMIAIDAVIRSGSYPNVRSLMQRFEMSERTVRADLAFLRDRLKAPLCFHKLRRGYYYTDLTWSLPTFVLSEGELIAFFLSVELAQRYLGTTVEAPLRRAVERLAASLPAELQVDLSELAQHYTFQSGATAGADPTLLAALFEALRERWPVEMTYFTASSGERRRRVIEPYHMFNVRGDWLVAGFDHYRQAVRQFAVSRIEEWRVDQSIRFVRDPDFSAEAYLRTAFLAERGDTAEEIAIWFDPQQARYIRDRQWHPTQQIEEHAGGALTLRFWSGALGEVRRWVMSYGRHARALSPARLCNEIREELAATTRMYEIA